MVAPVGVFSEDLKSTAIQTDFQRKRTGDPAGIIWWGFIRDTDFPAGQIHVKMELREVVAAFGIQVLHQKAGDPRTQLVFQLNTVFILFGVGGPVRYPVEFHGGIGSGFQYIESVRFSESLLITCI